MLSLLEATQLELPVEQTALGRLMGVHSVAVIDGRFYNLQERSAPLVELEGMGLGPFETIPPARVIHVFLHDLRCTDFGLSGDVMWPATRVSDPGSSFWPPSTLWHSPAATSDLVLTGWRDWLRAEAESGVPLASIIGARGLDAYREFLLFRAWAAPQAAEQVIELHKAVGGPLRDISKLAPDAVGQRVLRDYGADVALDGEKARGVGKRGRESDRQRAVIELAALARLLRQRDGLSSWARAYEEACRARPEWVPEKWRNGDPGGMLAKAVVKLKSTRWAYILKL